MLTYPLVPRPWVVDAREAGTTATVERYLCPKPCTVEVSEAVLTYLCPRPCVVDVREPGTTVKVEMYVCPRPLTVEPSDCVLTYPKAPREFVFDVRVDPKLNPVTVEVRRSANVLTYPRPYTVDVT